jgi:hypothetical protein
MKFITTFANIYEFCLSHSIKIMTASIIIALHFTCKNTSTVLNFINTHSFFCIIVPSFLTFLVLSYITEKHQQYNKLDIIKNNTILLNAYKKKINVNKVFTNVELWMFIFDLSNATLYFTKHKVLNHFQHFTLHCHIIISIITIFSVFNILLLILFIENAD